VIGALVALALTAAPASGDASVERRREEIAREILRLGLELRREIVAGNVAAIAARVPPEGLRCAGRLVPRARVERDLSTPGAWLHDALYGRKDPAPRGSPSLASLLRSSHDVAMGVSFAPDPRAALFGRPCLEFRAKGAPPPGTPLCFEKRGARWWLTESLYPCG
jgi:hypothetical protein